MNIIEQLLSNGGTYEEKKAIIDGLDIDTLYLISTKHGDIKSMIDKCCNGDDLRIINEFRVGNDWNSEFLGVYINCPKLLAHYSVLGDSTDTEVAEYFDVFFRRGMYSSNDNRLGLSVSYSAAEKMEAMRSILLQCVYNKFSEDAQREKVIRRLNDYKIINPILDKWYRKYNLWYVDSWTIGRSKACLDAYHTAQKNLSAYIEDNWMMLQDKTNEELIVIYTKVFGDAFNKDLKERGW